MNARVKVLGGTSFKNKAEKTSYVLYLERDETRDNVIGHEVYRAFTSSRHYETITSAYLKAKEPVTFDGYLNFENGMTTFYLPKSEVID